VLDSFDAPTYSNMSNVHRSCEYQLTTYLPLICQVYQTAKHNITGLTAQLLRMLFVAAS